MSRSCHPLHLLATVLLGFILTGCAAFRPNPPDVQLAGLTISDLSLSHANFLANLSLYNPNSTALDIEGLEFTLFLDEIKVARGATGKALSIPAEQSAQATLRLSTSFLDLFRLAQKLKGLDEIPFRIAGEVKVGGPGFFWLTVPVDSEGTIPLAGTLGQIFAGPEEFWRQPGRFTPDGTAAPAPSNPTGR